MGWTRRAGVFLSALWDGNTNKYIAIKLMLLAFDLATTKGSKHAAVVLSRPRRAANMRKTRAARKWLFLEK